ncbi:uncharacterized protein LOC123674248 [Harmonia axyridis]|uniref:uncharacterized protein LOC123674248 n=1 Tax=Harmonia axyridis TaxID=115357 RepID=UPI001E277F5F|nr:uncharacterized protein LOC123674248 [Harmonia axyridis]
MFILSVAYLTFYLPNSHAKLLLDSLPVCIIEENLFWEVYDRHFDEVNKLKVIILGSANFSADVREFSSYFLRVMSGKEIFFADVKVKYRYINRSKTLPPINLNGPAIVDMDRNVKYFSGSPTYWRRVKYYSADPQHVVIVIVWNVEDLRQALIEDRKFIIHHSRSLYSILFVSSEPFECPLWKFKIGDILNKLWYHFKTLNVIAQTPCSCDQDKIFLLKPFYPTGPSSWGGLDVFPMSTDDRSIHRMLNSMKHMFQYPMKVSIFERLPTATRNLSKFMQQNFIYQNLIHSGGYSGVDGAMLENFSKFMHFNLTIVGCDSRECFGTVYPNGTVTGSLGLVASDRVELSTNARFLKHYNTSKIEFTSITYSDQVCFIVRKASIVPSWMFLYKAFDYPSWLCIFFFLVACIMFSLLMKMLGALLFGKYISFKMRVIIHILLTPNHPNLKKGQAIFTTVYLMYSVIFTGIFQAVMVKLFSVVSRFQEINTIESLLDENYQILSSLDIFTEDQMDITKKLNERVLREFEEKALIRVATSNENYATLERKRDAEYVIESYYTTSEDEPLLHIVAECPVSYFMAYIVPAESPYRKRFDHLISVFREAGLIEYWYDLMVANLILEQKVKQNRGRREKTRPFSLEEVQFPFIILVLGLMLSASIFTMEICMKKRHIIKIVSINKLANTH